MTTTERLLGGLAGVLGAAGVALAAAAAHVASGGSGLSGAAFLLVAHAAALVALAGRARVAPTATLLVGLALGFGALLFAGDLAARAFLGGRLFANAAPAGGMVMIAGWLLHAVVSVLPRRGPRTP